MLITLRRRKYELFICKRSGCLNQEHLQWSRLCEVHAHTAAEDLAAPGSGQLVPLFFCSTASCFSRVSLSSLSLNNSIFSSVFSNCTCFSWARALSIATLSRPCTHTHTYNTVLAILGELEKWEWCRLFKSFWDKVAANHPESNATEARSCSWLLALHPFQAEPHLNWSFYQRRRL